MKRIIKNILILLGLYNPAKGVKINQECKAEVLLSYKELAMNTFIETGTFRGDMIEALKKYFKNIYSIELDKNLYDAAICRFNGENNVHLYCGDSAKEINNILKQITSTALIWLDAYTDGDINFKNSPIEAELRAIFNHLVKGHVVLIDDARHFNMSDIRKIKKMAKDNNYSFLIDEGLFRLTPVFKNS